MTAAAQADFLVRVVHSRRKVLIAGGTSTGESTRANGLLALIATIGDRVLVLEDTIELQCAARDHVPLRTRAGVVSMTALVYATMRPRPDGVGVGEVRGPEALDLVKVWDTPPKERNRHHPRRLGLGCAAAPGACIRIALRLCS